MLYSIFVLFANIFILFGGYNLFNIIKSGRDDWEKINELNFTGYCDFDQEMIYNIKGVIEKNEKLNHTLDELKVIPKYITKYSKLYFSKYSS